MESTGTTNATAQVDMLTDAQRQALEEEAFGAWFDTQLVSELVVNRELQGTVVSESNSAAGATGSAGGASFGAGL